MQVELTTSQKEALDVLENDTSNVFLTGYAGTGKSFLVSHFLSNKDSRSEYPVLGSTGVSALLVRGRTFHSFFGLGASNGPVEQIVKQATDNKRVGQRLRKAKAIVLDEVSMISGYTLMAAEMIARFFLESSEPWGGLRVIVVGDFAQLPPVDRQSRKPWAFLSPTWGESKFAPLILTEPTRTQDEKLIEVLNQVRNGVVDDFVEEFLNERKQTTYDPLMTRLFPLREQVSQFNLEKLSEISGDLISVATRYSGQEPFVSSLKKNAPVDEVLHLKKGAQVMIRVNDPMLRYVNGSVGKIVECKDDILTVQIKNRVFEFEKMSFTWMDGQGEIKAKAENFPVQLSWATTIHKSQGMTLDSAWIDLTRFWEAGQTYVALSRVKTSANLLIQDWNKSAIKADPFVKDFYEKGCPSNYLELQEML
jgi:ATP-dependent DNA helicase PIF1